MAQYSEIDIVAHSMGGIVASRFLTTSAENRAKVKHFISIGTPYQGSAKALYVFETGRFFEIGSEGSFLDTIFQGITSEYYLKFKNLSKNYYSVYELLPNKFYFADMGIGYIKKDGVLLTTQSQSYQFLKTRSWAKKANGTVKPMFSFTTTFNFMLHYGDVHVANSNVVDTYKIYGTGHDTIRRVVYKNGDFYDIETTPLGDGTVLCRSAYNGDESQIYVFNETHTGLIKNTDVLNLVGSIISGTLTTSSAVANLNEQQENENGWPVEGDNKRINLVVRNCDSVRVFTKNGEELQSDGDELFYTDKNGNQIYAGSIWYLGENSVKYYLMDGEYKTEINGMDMGEKTNIRVEYQDSGYCIKSMFFDKISEDVVLSVDNSAVKDVQCSSEKAAYTAEVFTVAE